MMQKSEIIIPKSGIKDPWLDYIWRRVHWYKKSFVCVVTGDSGDGKSWSVLKMAEILDPNFSIDNVVFSAEEYMQRLDRIKRKGEVIIWDEVGVGANSRRWDSIINIAVTEVMMTQRYQNPIIFLTVPDQSMSDSNIRKMVNAYCEAKRPGSRPGEVYVYIVNRDRKNDKTFYVHPRVTIKKRLPDGTIKKIRYRYDKMIFKSLPSKKLQEDYEPRHKKFKQMLRKKNIKTVELSKKYEQTSVERVRTSLKNVINEPELYENVNKKLDWRIVKDLEGLSRDDAQTVVRIAEKELKSD